MKPISSEIVEKIWKEMGAMSVQSAPRMIEAMQKEQPVVLAYLMAVGKAVLNRDEQELLLYLGTVIWRIMLQGDKSLTQITPEVLDKAEDKNMKMLEYLEKETEAEFIDTVEKTIENYPQPEVLKYVVEALMEREDDGTLIRDESKGMMLIYLKTVIDCFDK